MDEDVKEIVEKCLRSCSVTNQHAAVPASPHMTRTHFAPSRLGRLGFRGLEPCPQGCSVSEASWARLPKQANCEDSSLQVNADQQSRSQSKGYRLTENRTRTAKVALTAVTICMSLRARPRPTTATRRASQRASRICARTTTINSVSSTSSWLDPVLPSVLLDGASSGSMSASPDSSSAF